jgi:hypothetical protein
MAATAKTFAVPINGSFRRVVRIADYKVVMGRMGWRCPIKKEMNMGRHVFRLAGESNATSR